MFISLVLHSVSLCYMLLASRYMSLAWYPAPVVSQVQGKGTDDSPLRCNFVPNPSDAKSAKMLKALSYVDMVLVRY